jgi:hypothetical protein
MMKKIILLFTLLSIVLSSNAQSVNLLINGNFQSLKSWKSNDNLRKTGKVTLLPEEHGVTIYNPIIDLDGALYQDIPVNGHEWFYYSVRINQQGMMRASMGFIALDESGNSLKIITPTKIAGPRWNNYSGTISVPPETKNLRVLLSVLDGKCSFADVIVNKVEGPERIITRSSFVKGKGFSVHAYDLDRPFWELFSDDLNGDGKPEIIGCDVDGIVTVRNPGTPAFLSYAAGAMVYQFESADLNKDGKKEILISLVDPKFRVKAIDFNGNVVCEFKGPSSHERIATGDMDGNGYPEVAISKNNGVAGSGIAGGVVLYNTKGDKLWEKEGTLREFHFGDVHTDPGTELIVGGPGIEFRIYNMQGKLLDEMDFGKGLLDHFIVTDIDNDGKTEIIASSIGARRATLKCIRGKELIWENNTPGILGGGNDSGMNIATGNFDKLIPGLETILVGTHSIFLVDAKGTLLYQNREEGNWAYWQSWADKGINSLDIAFWNEEDPHLYLSSSRFRQRAYYNLIYGNNDDLSTYQVPDQEKHLEDIYNTLKQRAAVVSASKEKLKVFMALGEFASVPESTLRIWRDALTKMETPNLEYLAMYEASDLYGHERGQKMTTDQIVERARLLEKTGIPFGYFSTHGGQVWISEEAIRKSKEAAPNMFRFLYIAENLETLYSPLYKDVLKWTNKALDYCAAHNMKMIFKEKHDVWGLLPSDKEVSDVLFSPAHRNTTVPIWSTNQPYQPEIQLGGMVGLKMAGLCNEFGMSTQYWNWHEWGRYPRGIRDVSAAFVCPSDIILRLDLMGIALGGTWIHIEGGQSYLQSDISKGLVPTALRHRDLAYELIRKNILIPGATPANINKTSLIRSFNNELEKGKAEKKRIAYPYYDRNTEALRKGFIPARYLFETYSTDAFPWIAYSQAWNVSTCFPTTPYGWIPVLPPAVTLPPERYSIKTNGEKVLFGQEWKESVVAAPEVGKTIAKGAEDIAIEAPGTCLILQKDESKEGVYTALMMDPGYLAPTGVATTLISRKGNIAKATDMVTGETMKISGNCCPLQILPGAFRVLKIELIGK